MIEYSTDDKAMQDFNRKMKQIKGLPKRFLTNVTLHGESKMKSDTLGGQILHRRTGLLSASVGSKVEETQRDMIGTVGSGVRSGKRVKYANIHTEGGVIKPKSGKYLAIPLPSIKTRGGGGIRGGALSPRDYPDTFVRRSRRGKLLIWQKRGKRARPIFALKTSVKIPKRDYLKATSRIVQGDTTRIFNKTYKELVR